MAEGLTAAIAAELLDALFNSDAYDGPTNIYAKLHIGVPGAAGAGNPAVNTTRQEVTFAAASGGTVSNDAAVVWVSVSTSEDYSYISLWDNVSAGNCLATGAITANAVTAGDTFTIAIGDLDVVITPVAA